MDAAHIHLLLNHVPVLGAVFGLAVLAVGLVRDSDEILRVGLGTLVVVGAASVAVYLTGEPAEELVEGLQGISEVALERHEEAALRATWGGGLLGALAAVGLWRYRDVSVARPFATATLVLTLVASGLMAWTANSGGKVHHPELRGAVVTADGGDAREEGREGSGGEPREADEDQERREP